MKKSTNQIRHRVRKYEDVSVGALSNTPCGTVRGANRAVATDIHEETPRCLALDAHPGPTDDIRSIIEPLGVEFIQHIIMEKNRCNRMCHCDISPKAPHVTLGEAYRTKPDKKALNRIYKDTRSASDMARADAFMSTINAAFIELYMKYNGSIIFVAPIRYNFGITFAKGTRTHSGGKDYIYIYSTRIECAT